MRGTAVRTSSPDSRSSGRPLICFYGDDFTGSTDALGQFCRFGLGGILLLRVPTDEQLRAYSRKSDVVGIAGVSRALPTAQMTSEVRPALLALAKLAPRLIQYKICSTFDSSPAVGSIGRMIELGMEMFGERPVPVLAAQPEFGRYTAFGNHFVEYKGLVYRLDRHPTMSCHPSTPMTEADLCRVLAGQTALPVSLVNLLQLTDETDPARRAPSLSSFSNAPPGPLVIDAVNSAHLVRAAELIWGSDSPSPRFVVGSGGLSYGLGHYLTAGKQATMPPVHRADQVFAVSGSCSAQTAQQVAHAVAHGWTGIYLEPRHLLDPLSRENALAAVSNEVMSAIHAGTSVVVYTAQGDGRDRTVGNPMKEAGIGLELVRQIGAVFGRLLDDVLAGSDVRRVIVAGGDTSGYTLRSLDAYGLEVEAPLAVAGALCRLRSTAHHLDGAEVVLKGGQVGNDDFFELVRRGARPVTTVPDWYTEAEVSR